MAKSSKPPQAVEVLRTRAPIENSTVDIVHAAARDAVQMLLRRGVAPRDIPARPEGASIARLVQALGRQPTEAEIRNFNHKWANVVTGVWAGEDA